MSPYLLNSLLLIAILLATSPAHGGGARPNLIVILVDDMGFSDVGCYGGEIDTPNIDALAANGLRFTQFYNSGRCCPTRASLMTGLHPHQVGIGHMTESPGKPLKHPGPYQGYLNDRCTTLAEVLKKAGYHTLMTGKWHLGFHDRDAWPLSRGFDRYYGGIAGSFNYFKPGGGRPMYSGYDEVPTPDDFYATDAFTDKAIEFISEAQKQDNEKPFFLYLAYNAPHWPLNSKWAEYQKYRGKYRDGWPKLMQDRVAKQRAIGLFPEEMQPAPHEGPAWESLTDQQRDELDVRMAAYAGCIDSIDQNIGKLRTELKQIGVWDNTLVLFLSDNGACQEGGKLGSGTEETIRNPPLETTGGARLGHAWANACNTPFRLYKHFVHEGGACTPMIAHWPAGIAGEQQGKFVRQVAQLQDIMATCLDLSGGTYPDTLPPHQGASLLPLLQGIDEPIHAEPLYWEHEGNASVRWGDWKLVREYKKPWELYNLKQDRTELVNLAQAEPDRVRQMSAMWIEWAESVGVAYPKRFNMYEFLRERDKREQAAAKPQ